MYKNLFTFTENTNASPLVNNEQISLWMERENEYKRCKTLQDRKNLSPYPDLGSPATYYPNRMISTI